MDTTPIDNRIEAAFAAALANPVKVAETDGVRTEVYDGPEGSGFMVIGTIQIGGYRATRVKQHGPETELEKAWPANIEAEAAKALTESIETGEAHVRSQGFTSVRLVALLNAFLIARNTAGSDEALAAARPKLVALYTWTQTVQAMAASGQRFLPPAPFTFEEVITEA